MIDEIRGRRAGVYRESRSAGRGSREHDLAGDCLIRSLALFSSQVGKIQE